MSLLDEIINCKDEEVDSIIDLALKTAIEGSNPNKNFGFMDNVTVLSKIVPHKGFMNPGSRIRFNHRSTITYSMKTTDYLYEFARYVKKMNITNNGTLVKYIQNFVNSYFGMLKSTQDIRDVYFEEIAFNTTTTDDEYFGRINSFELGDFKGKNIAMCTERAAMAQNLLSLFGFEVYYCVGCVDNNGKEEPHCFNIARAKDSFVLLDYSIFVPVLSNDIIVDYTPFQGEIKLDEIGDILFDGVTKEFSSYEYIKTSDGITKTNVNQRRIYKVGSVSLKKSNSKSM